MTKRDAPWNKDRSVGQRLAFRPHELQAIAQALSDTENYHDRCLFMVGTDSFLRCSDLLRLKVHDVQHSTGEIRASFDWKQKKTGTNVHPVLTTLTKAACRDWIKISGKLPEHFLFTRTKANSAPPISASSYRRMVKQWAELIDLDGEQYSTHSLRRSKPSWMYAQGVSVEDLAQLLGHRSIESTLRYLGLSLAKAQAEALKHDIFKVRAKKL